MFLSEWVANLAFLGNRHGDLEVEFFVKLADSFIPVMPEATGWSDDMTAICVILVQDPERKGQIIDIREGHWDASNFDGSQTLGTETPKV